jgi:hypothetical protein
MSKDLEESNNNEFGPCNKAHWRSCTDHIHRMTTTYPIMNSVLDNIGHTPLVRLNNIPRIHQIPCSICKLNVIY